MRISWSVLLANKIGEEFTEQPSALASEPRLHCTEECEAQEEISQGTTMSKHKATILELHANY